MWLRVSTAVVNLSLCSQTPLGHSVSKVLCLETLYFAKQKSHVLFSGKTKAQVRLRRSSSIFS